MKPRPNRNITRIDTGSTHGFEVRFMRRGYVFEKLFSDAVYGGKRKALAAAREYRDELEAEYPHYSRKEVARIKSERNTSGVVGVRLSEETDDRWPSKPVYLYWVAQWSPSPGVRKTKRFSVNKYGEEEAFRLALAARRKGVREMDE